MVTTNGNEKPVWFITGCSTGFGRDLASHVLERGYRTAVTARNVDAVKDLAAKGEALLLKLDVTDQGEIDAAIKEDQVRRMFEVNVFGLSRMIRAALPGMRKRRKGFIVNFSSIGGLRSFPSVGYYNATKFAVEGLSESLWQEVEPLGIKVMLVEPSGFRTDWAGRSANESKRQIDDYAATAGKWRSKIRAISGKQPGDPVRAAHAIVKAVESPNPPHHLLLGNDAYNGAMAKLEELRKEFTAWEAVSRGADFPTKKQVQTA